jgi:hypothetical protein
LAIAIAAAGAIALATAHCARGPGGFDSASGQAASSAPDATADAPTGSFFDDASCASLPPAPTGPQCACAWTDCNADELVCHCAPQCYEQSPDCLITVGDSGAPTTSNAFLSSCTIDCVYQPGVQSEFSTTGALVCRASDCRRGSQGRDGGPAAPDTDAQLPPPGPAGCPVPVPGPTTITVWIAGITGFKFKIPFSDWALATAHVWHKLPELYPAHLDLRPSPSFYFATGMVETFWGCSLRLPPFDPTHAGQYFMQWVQPLLPDGCLAITVGASQELQMLFPEVFDGVNVTHDSTISSVNQVALGRDNIVSSVLTKAYVDLVNYALMVEQGAPDPDAWFAAANDPWAKVEMIAQMYNQGPYNPDVQKVLTQCQNVPLESCIVEGIQYVKEVTAATQNLEASVAAGRCYDDPIGHDDITYYLDRLFPLYVGEDQHAITMAALAAFDQAAGGRATAPFQQVALPVLDAIDGAMKSKLYCPEAMLSQLWQKHCPH